MSKNCEDCEHFHGYDYSDGTACCDYEDANGEIGYEFCPYNDAASANNKGIKIEIDSGFMSEYIKHTISNTVESKAYEIACRQVKDIINDTIKEEIQSKVKKNLDEKIEALINDALTNFMDGEIHTGGLYGGTTVTRKKYIADKIEDRLSKVSEYTIKSQVETEVKNQIDKFTRSIRDSINKSIKAYFDDATRAILTENVVSMLMCNDTYKKLSDSMGRLLPEQ